ncbi:MAG: hypothetical protein ABI977_19165 [Acidobacteriota bacterium]
MTGTDQMRICYKCDYATTQPLKVCPQCGQQQFRTANQIRTLGWVLVVIGAALTIFMAWLSVVVGQAILLPNLPGTTARFTGGPNMVLFIAGIFGVVLAIGIASFSAGLFQIRNGRRNKSLVKVMLMLATMFVIVAGVVRVFV